MTNNTVDTPTSRDSDVTAAESTDYPFTAADFPFTDNNAGDVLESVKIASRPARGYGALSLDGTALGSSDLPKTVTAAELGQGKLVFSPVTGQFGDGYASFRFRVNDGDADSADAYTMTVDVDPDPDQTVLVSNLTSGTLEFYETFEETGIEFTQGFHTAPVPPASNCTPSASGVEVQQEPGPPSRWPSTIPPPTARRRTSSTR